MTCLILLFWFALNVNSFKSIVQKPRNNCMMLRMSSQKATLDGQTLWRISFSLQKEGFRSTSASIRARFVEARGYEPPSGRVFIEDDYNGLIKVDENGYAGSWTLSEDKEDRKDGLWIWGLFKEPKYPFLYFTLGAYNTTINARTNDEEPIFGGLGIPNEKLYIRFDHNVSPDRNHRLSNGRVEFKESEFVKADPFGVGGTVDVGDVVNGGSIQITPVLDDDEGAMSSIGHE